MQPDPAPATTSPQGPPRGFPAFTVSQGRALGLSDAAMRREAYARPFYGVRSLAGSSDRSLLTRCSELSVALTPLAVFSHATAARLWGMPLPAWLSDELHVTVPDAAAVRRAGVLGWKRAGGGLAASRLGAISVTSPAQTWVTLATMTDARGGRMPRDWLVAIGDFLVSGRRVRWGREEPLATAADLGAVVAAHGSRRGAAQLNWALERVRAPVDSPPETFLRLGLVRSGLPEPDVQPDVMTALGLRHPDLGYVDRRVLLEYLGDVHRTDRATWLKDLERVQLFRDAGYEPFLVGAADLTPAGLSALCARVRRALRSPRAHR